MSTHPSSNLVPTGALALVLLAVAPWVAARTPPAAHPAPSAQSSQAFYPGTESSATYPIPNGTLTVNAGMPATVQDYGPPPSFATLDANHDGRISEKEAQAYPPLDSDFLYASGGTSEISRARYTAWVKTQH